MVLEHQGDILTHLLLVLAVQPEQLGD